MTQQFICLCYSDRNELDGQKVMLNECSMHFLNSLFLAERGVKRATDEELQESNKVVFLKSIQKEQCLFYSSVGNVVGALCFSSFTLSIHLICLSPFTPTLFLSFFLPLLLCCRAYQDLLGKLGLQVTLAGRCSEKYKNMIPVPQVIL